ncbi:MAG: xanthine dehydrogenase family protein molybdopterin-binding subunit [Candidatus Bathyarchaeia archaeon]
MSFKIIKSDEAEQKYKEWKVLGKPTPCVNSYMKVTGTATFTDDILRPKMLYGKILRSPFAHAKIIEIDTSKAEALPGVACVVTYKDIADMGIVQAPPKYILADRVFYVGDIVAAVAAEDEAIAEEALDLIKVEYEPLPFWLTPEEASSAPPMHPEVANDNIAIGVWPPYHRCTGDVEQGFKESEIIVEIEFKKPNIKHMFLENFAAVAEWRGDELHLWSHPQIGAVTFAMLLASIFNMPTNKVQVYQCFIGGGFGGKMGESPLRIAVLAAMLARKTGRPVKIRTNVREHFVEGGVLDPGIATFKYKVGADQTGSLKAIEATVLAGQGERTINLGIVYCGDTIFNNYRIPNRSFKAYPYYTNTPMSEALRGYGSQAGVPPLEAAMNEIAESLGMDPVDFIVKNGLQDGDMVTQYLHNDFQLAGGSLPELVRKAAEQFGWKEKWKGWGIPTEVSGSKMRGIGVAVATHTAWGVPSPDRVKDTVIVKVNVSDGTVEWIVDGRDMGSGFDTAVSQVIAETLGVEVKDVVHAQPCSVGQPIGGWTFASKALQSTVFAAYNAANNLKRNILAAAASVLNVDPSKLVLDLKGTRVYVADNPAHYVRLSKIGELYGGVLIGIGSCPSHYGGPESYMDPITGKRLGMKGMFCSFAEVEVDIETGKVDIIKLLVAIQPGMILNPLMVYGQVIGSAVHGLGCMLWEGIVYDEKTGTPLNTSFIEYPIPTALDITEEQITGVAIVDPNDARLTPYRAKGVAEGVFAALWHSIHMAVYNAIGKKIREFPLRPEKILKALGKAQFPQTKGVT